MEFAEAIVAKLAERAQRSHELDELMATPEVLADHKLVTQYSKEKGQLEEAVSLHEELQALLQEHEEAELLAEDEDPGTAEYAREILDAYSDKVRELDDRIKSALVTEKDDYRDKVIVEVRAGTGGDEATLFAADLYRMYKRFAESKRWKLEELEMTASEVGGFKEITFGLSGEGAWRLMRFESGGHRVQRVPSTETQGRIHTSAATVAVLPEAEEAEIDIRDGDLRIDTMRSGGPGGQSVNTTSSAVRITHLPTDTVVICQDEKSQHKNKAKAMRILLSRLLEAEQRRLHEERAEQRKSQVGSGDRSARVRTYNFPQNRATDHRLGENYSLEQVIAGKMDALLDALDEREREERIANL